VSRRNQEPQTDIPHPNIAHLDSVMVWFNGKRYEDGYAGSSGCRQP
jgi:hypothetical protein